MICTNCGKPLNETAAFCPNCGRATGKQRSDPEGGMNVVDPPSMRLDETPATGSSSQELSPALTDNTASVYELPSSAPQPQTSVNPSPVSTQPASNRPELFNAQPGPYNAQPTPSKKAAKPRRKSKKLWIAVLAVLLILAILVQNFAYPFLLQKVSGGALSTLAVKTVKPGDEADGTVSAAETKSVRSYAANIKNAYAWQLTGTEKSLFNRLNQKLKEVTKNTGGTEVGLLDMGLVITAYAANGVVENPVATELSNIACLLSQYGYDNLSLALLAAAVEGNPLDPTLVNNIACSLRSMGYLEDSHKLLSYAYKLAPDDLDILINLGNTCLDMGNVEHANIWFREVLDFDNDYGPAHEGLMLCYMAEKNYRVAMRHMIKAATNCYTPAIQKVYDSLRYRADYEDIRDQVLKDFTMDQIAKTYQRSRDDISIDDIGASHPLRIPKFPTYGSPEAFIANIDDIYDFGMSLINPGLDVIKEVGQILKEAEELFNSFESGGLGGLLKAIDAKSGGASKQDNPGVEDGNITLSLSYEREAFTISLLGDYLDMKVDEITGEMNEKFSKVVNDPLMDMLARSEREIKQRGDNEEAWLQAMADNWGNSFALSDETVKSNRVNLNQHMEAFYQTVVPAYNDMKSELEEYWSQTGGILRYVGDDQAFKTLSLERRIKTTGTLATFGSLALLEGINVPLVYAGFAVGGSSEASQGEAAIEKLNMPADEQKNPERFVTLGIKDVLTIELSDSEISSELSLLIRAGVSHNLKKGTTTLMAGAGVGTGDLLPGIGAGTSKCRYWTFKGSNLTDYGNITKTYKKVNVGMSGVGFSYTTTNITKVSKVTHAVDKTVEKAISGNLIIGSMGLKK